MNVNSTSKYWNTNCLGPQYILYISIDRPILSLLDFDSFRFEGELYRWRCHETPHRAHRACGARGARGARGVCGAVFRDTPIDNDIVIVYKCQEEKEIVHITF